MSVLSCVQCEKGVEDNFKEKDRKEQRPGEDIYMIYFCMCVRRKSNTIRSDRLNRRNEQ